MMDACPVEEILLLVSHDDDVDRKLS